MTNEDLKVVLTTMGDRFWCLLWDEPCDDLMMLARFDSKSGALAFCNNVAAALHCIVLDAPEWTYVPNRIKFSWEQAKIALWPYVPEGRVGEKAFCRNCRTAI